MYKIISVPLLKQYIVIITVNLVILCAGMDIGWTSPVLVKLRDLQETPLSRPITEDEGGWIVSIGYVGSILTLPCMGFLMDRIGRRYCILLAILPKIVSGLITIFASKVWMLFVARVMSGVTTTGGMMVIMVYTTEFSSKEIRGALGSFISIFSNLGILMMLGIGPYISYVNLNIMVTAVTVCASIPLMFIPDTPYSLFIKGRNEEAKKVLKRFRVTQAFADEEFKELAQSESNPKFDIREIFKKKIYLKSLAINAALGIGVQLVGFNFISFYLQTILELSNTTVSSALGSVIIGVIQVLSSIIAGVLIDRFGRRPLLMTTLLGMAVGMFGLGVFFIVKQHGEVIGLLNYLPLMSIAIVTLCYSGGIGSLFFVIVSELLDGPIRAIGNSIGAVITNVTLFLISKYTMAILSAMGPDATFMMFGVMCVLMCLFIYFFVPETKHKTIAEIQRALGTVEKEDEKKYYVSRF